MPARPAGISRRGWDTLVSITPGLTTFTLTPLLIHSVVDNARFARLTQSVGAAAPTYDHATTSGDGRYTLATATDLGVAKAGEAAPGHVALVRHVVFDSLSPAQATP